MNKNKNQIKPMLCPVCGEFYFSKLSKDDIEIFNIHPNDCCCSICGWHYDLEQTLDPNKSNESNALSLNQYREQFKQIRKLKPHYTYLEENRPTKQAHKCPVCGEYTFKDIDSYDICTSCGWEDDGYFTGGGANTMSLEEAILDFKEKRKQNPKYKWIDSFK